MLQDLNYGTNIEPIQPVLKRMQAQIDYLDKAKANCVNMQSCNCDGYITFSMDYDGNETIKGKHNLAVPICGYTDIETPLNDLLTSGGGGLATCVLQDACNCYGAIFLGNGCDGVYSRIGINSDLSYNNDTLHTPNISTITATLSNICTCNGLSIDNTVEIKNGEIKAIGPSSCSIVSNTGCGTFTNKVTTPTVETSTLCEVSNINSSTDIIYFKDKYDVTLGSINGTAICFTDGNFTNVNTTNFTASNIGNKCGYLGEISGYVGLFACGTNNIKLVTGDACVFELSCNKMHYSNVINIQEAGSPYSGVSAIAVGKDASNYSFGCAHIIYARGNGGTMGSTHTVHWEAGTKQCDVYKAIYCAIGAHEDNATWSVYGKTEFLEPLGRKMAPMFVSSGANCFSFSGFPYWSGSADITFPFLTVISGCEDGVLAGGTVTITAW